MPRVRFRNAVTGDELLLPYCSTRVQAHVTLEWYFKDVAQLLQWPKQFIRLLVTGLDGNSRILRYTRLLREQSRTPLTSLQQEADADIRVAVLPVFSTKKQYASTFA